MPEDGWLMIGLVTEVYEIGINLNRFVNAFMNTYELNLIVTIRFLLENIIENNQC